MQGLTVAAAAACRIRGSICRRVPDGAGEGSALPPNVDGIPSCPRDARANAWPHSRPRPLPRWLLPTLVLVLVATTAAAHSVGLSKGDYHVAGDTADVTVVFARPELTAAFPELDADRNGTVSESELQKARAAIATLLVPGIEVRADADRCAGDVHDASLVEQDGIALAATFRCRQPISSIVFELRFLDSLPAGHRHLAITETTGSTPLVAHAGQQTVRVARTAGADRTGSLAALVWPLFRLGLEHILTGYDHLVFLLGVILVGVRVRPLLGIITAFTAAHSITLAVSTLGWWTPSGGLVEPAIALSIGYIGIENWSANPMQRRWRIAFLFGLIHGFGFAGALHEIAIPAVQVPAALAAFNIGVEAGQLLILSMVLPLVLWLRQQAWFAERGVKGLSGAIAVAGAWWFVVRVV